MTEEIKKYLKFAKDISKKAGKIMLKNFNKENDYSYKEDKTIVTSIDKKINRLVITRVKKKFPTHAIDGEEEKFGKSTYTWVVDPIDGTAMYQRKIPVSVFSIALVKDGKPIVGVVYDPFTKNLYSAAVNNGAYQNDKRIFVNNYTLENKESLVNIDMWPAAKYNLYPIEEEIGKKSYTITIGSIIRAGIGVAKGDFTLALFPGTKDKNCDIAALKIIVEEAGGIVTDLYGNEQRYDQPIKGAIICNKNVYNKALTIVKERINEND